MKWRGDSYLHDGKKEGLDLSGGWLDAGGVPAHLQQLCQPACNSCALRDRHSQDMTHSVPLFTNVCCSCCACWLSVCCHADHLKLIFPMCWAVTNLAWSLIDGADVLKATKYDGKSNYEWALATLLHGVDFLLKCHIKDDAFVIQVGTHVLVPVACRGHMCLTCTEQILRGAWQA